MKNKSPKVIFFGNERIATGVSTTAPTLRALIDAKYDVCSVVVNQNQTRSRKVRELEIADVAKRYGIPLLTPNSTKEITKQLMEYKASIGILVAYGKIVPEEIINLFPRGIVNIHPSLLPLHRGPTPLESVILNGEAKTGVSLMALSKEMDAGPVYAQSALELTGNESKQQLADKLLDIGSTMLIKSLPGILSREIKPTSQNNEHATYDKMIIKDDGLIDWSQSSEQIARSIRAYALWPKSRTILGGIGVIIISAEAAEGSGQPGSYKVENNNLEVYCARGSLKISRLQPEGKKEMPVGAFLAGYKL